MSSSVDGCFAGVSPFEVITVDGCDEGRNVLPVNLTGCIPGFGLLRLWGEWLLPPVQLSVGAFQSSGEGGQEWVPCFKLLSLVL